MSNLYVLVGEAPNAATVGRPHLWLVPDDSGIPHTANRLRDLAGMTTPEYLRVFQRRDNVLPGIPRGGRWVKRHDEIARARADGLMRSSSLSEHFVLLGMRAARAFGLVKPEPLVWLNVCASTDDVRCLPQSLRLAAYLPHTSGLNRWWNDEENKSRGQEFLSHLSGSAARLHQT